MKLLTNKSGQPFLQLSDKIINLNTLTTTTLDEMFPVKAGKELKISKHRNIAFLRKAEKLFKISRVAKAYGTTWYKLESNIVLFAIIQGEDMQLVGNYPIHYLKLMYRYINSTLIV